MSTGRLLSHRAKDFATVVWFHGGGLTGGNRFVPSELQGKGLAVVAVNYRLSPKVQSPVYVEDAAAAVAWTLKNIERFGGSRKEFSYPVIQPAVT